MNQTIIIPRTLANRLLTLAQLTPDVEICGLISKNNQQKYQVYPIDNIASDKSCVFEMQPEQQINAFKLIREKQQDLFAIYHSHPDSEAIPSKKDLNDAAYTEALNIIISLSTKGVLDMRGYFYKNDKVETVDLIIE
ncbi:MAG: M67 family metallopeptidase [Gammaproteobacteria bacterium]|nr:M67 family metallopeptidase [Gammaproteobacteria bacterium]